MMLSAPLHMHQYSPSSEVQVMSLRLRRNQATITRWAVPEVKHARLELSREPTCFTITLMRFLSEVKGISPQFTMGILHCHEQRRPWTRLKLR